MAEESIALPVTSNSPDTSGGVNTRRSATGKMTSSKVVPNYLRASTGSCHDFCKFGNKHGSEEKERRPFLRKGIRKPPDGHHIDPDIQIFVPSKVRSQTNKVSLLSKSADSNSDALMSGLSRRKTSVPAGMLRKSVDNTKVSKLHESSFGKNKMLTGSLDSKVSGLIGTSSKAKITSSREEKKKSSAAILRTPPVQSLKKGMSTSQSKVDNPSNRASRSAEVLSLSEKLGSSLKLKSNNNAGRLSAGSNTDLVPKVALRKLQLSSPKVPKHNVSGAGRALSSPRVSLSPRSSLVGVAGLNATKNRSGKVISGLRNGKRNKTEQTKTENKIKKNVASNLQPKIQDKSIKKVANKQRMNNQVKDVSPDMVQEKTLYVIKMDTESKHLESDLNERLDGETVTVTVTETSPPPSLSIPGCSSSSSSSLTNEDEEESEYSLTDEEDSLDIEEQKKWNRKKGVVHSESQDPQPVKLRFRRGKVIEIETENEGPRKLKFRKRRSVGKEQSSKAERRISYRERGDEAGEVKKEDSEKVVLRHQDVDGKKDGQQGVLFNNVIEETASKLAETRKSKVKALVGAFETVISLQDGKPSSGNVNL